MSPNRSTGSKRSCRRTDPRVPAASSRLACCWRRAVFRSLASSGPTDPRSTRRASRPMPRSKQPIGRTVPTSRSHASRPMHMSQRLGWQPASTSGPRWSGRSSCHFPLPSPSTPLRPVWPGLPIWTRRGWFRLPRPTMCPSVRHCSSSPPTPVRSSGMRGRQGRRKGEPRRSHEAAPYRQGEWPARDH